MEDITKPRNVLLAASECSCVVGEHTKQTVSKTFSCGGKAGRLS